jgi:hypothetical protein
VTPAAAATATAGGTGPDSTGPDSTGPDSTSPEVVGTAGRPPAPPGPDTRQRLLTRWRTWRWPALVAVGVLLAAAITAALLRGSGGRDLDPNGTTPNGSKALVQILRQQGVDVIEVTRADQVPAAIAPGGTLVVVHPELLGPDDLTQLADEGQDLVLVGPDVVVLDRLARFAIPAGVAPAKVAAPDCSDPDAVAAGSTLAGGYLYQPASPGTGQPCYPAAGVPGAGSVLRGQSGSTRVTVLGQADVLRNGHLAEQGNAALALRVLGAHPRLVWFWPDPLALSGTDQPRSIVGLLPSRVRWLALQLALAALVAMIWRARRLGRLVPEPLPVVVRAAETQEGRARLYRQARARGRAAATLRTAALRRIAVRVDAPPEADPGTVVMLVADATGRPAPQLHAVLLGTPPPDDRALARLADELDEIEHALSRPAAGSAMHREAEDR